MNPLPYDSTSIYNSVIDSRNNCTMIQSFPHSLIGDNFVMVLVFCACNIYDTHSMYMLFYIFYSIADVLFDNGPQIVTCIYSPAYKSTYKPKYSQLNKLY